MNIVSLLNPRNVFPNLEVTDKQELLNTLIDSLEEAVTGEELDSIRNAVMEREEIMSTGVGKGLAIPHGKAEGIATNYAAFAILKDSIDYEAVDNEPVKLVFLLVGPQSSNSLHIKMLSRISRLMNNNRFRDELAECDTPEQVITVFEEGEKAHFGE